MEILLIILLLVGLLYGLKMIRQDKKDSEKIKILQDFDHDCDSQNYDNSQVLKANAEKIVNERWKRDKSAYGLFTSKKFRQVGRNIALIIIAGAIIYYHPTESFSLSLIVCTQLFAVFHFTLGCIILD